MAPIVMNTHRRRRYLATTVVLALALTGAMVPAAQASANSNATPVDVIFETTNKFRADVGQAPLTRLGPVDTVAQRWAERLRDERRLGHNPNYSSEMPTTGRSAAGENVAFACGYGNGTRAAEVMMQGWFNSAGHRRNMEHTRFTHIGIGFAYNSSTDCAYGVQNFGGYAQLFLDVPRTHAFHKEIEWLASSNITTGWADGTFRPRENVSRGAFAAFLYRLAGQPSVNLPSQSPFTDLPTSAPFYKEIVWLNRTGITTGYPDNTFRPEAEITRDAMAAFLYRYSSKSSGNSTSATAFKDVSSNSQFLTEMSWLKDSGITTGYTDNTFRPLAPVTREATAAFLQRLANY